MKRIILIAAIVIFSQYAFSQQFEEEQLKKVDFTEISTKVGGDFALQFQGLEHSGDSALIALGKGINLPTANFNITSMLAPGIKLHLVTYLSSRHHVEAWVKGGYLLIDELPFFNSEAIDKAMEYVTIKAGVYDLNFGDGHFRRSDNGSVLNNAFVGNYIMDAFTTAPMTEIMFRHKGIIAMGGISTGSLKPALSAFSGGNYIAYNVADELAFHWKAGYDKQLTEDVRLRATVSGFHNKNHHFGSLYNADRAGSRYYMVMNLQTGSSVDVDPASNHTSGRYTPGFSDEMNAYMVNLFAQAYGFELFGTYETNSGTSAFGGAEFSTNQIAAEILYRFGGQKQFFAGARYGQIDNQKEESIDRIQAVAGWKMTDNILLKLEYVNQNYNDFVKYGSNANFKGLMFEAGISF